MSKLLDGGTHTHWQEQIENEVLTKVKDFWVDEVSNSGFRVWKPEAWFTTWLPGEAGRHLHQELQKRKIDKRRGPNQLRWGYDNTGSQH